MKKENKIKVLILLSSSYGGGAERLVLDQIKYGNHNLIDYHIITLRKGNIESEFLKISKYTSLDIKTRMSIKGIKQLYKYCEKNNIQIIHSHLLEAEMYAFIIKFLKKELITINSKHVAYDNTKINFFMKKIEKIISKKENKIIAVSKRVKNYLLEILELNNKKIKTIYNGIDLSRFRKRKRKKNSIFTIGIIGRLEQQKGHKYLFEAIKNINSNIKILVIGTGSLENELKEICKKHKIDKKVEFLGYQKEIEEHYSSIDVLCVPSIYEGFGLIVAEAMASKTPVIYSNIEPINEVITREEGFPFPLKNVKKLTKQISFVINNPKKVKEKVDKAYERVKEKFDIKKDVKKVEKEYLDLLEK
jgi:glycosyltransferase involved in cell wall biosynthesis